MKSLSAVHLSSLATIGLLVLLPFASCTTKIDPPMSPTQPPMRPVIPDSIQSIFTASCAVPACHVAGTAFADEILDADFSYVKTVNVPAFQDPARMRILPNEPDESYLVMKITGAPGIQGLQMPRGAPPLPDSLQMRIKNWVTAGAPPALIPAAPSRLGPQIISSR